MNVFVATPIHKVKEYAIDPWLINVKDTIKAHGKQDRWTLCLSDNTGDDGTFLASATAKADATGLSATVIPRRITTALAKLDDRLSQSREQLRQEFLLTTDEWYLSWECDVTVIDPSLLVPLWAACSVFDIVIHAYPDRENQNLPMAGMGFTAIRRAVLEKITWEGFGKCDAIVPNCFYGNEGWFLTKARRAGFKIAVVDNCVKFNHLAG